MCPRISLPASGSASPLRLTATSLVPHPSPLAPLAPGPAPRPTAPQFPSPTRGWRPKPPAQKPPPGFPRSPPAPLDGSAAQPCEACWAPGTPSPKQGKIRQNTKLKKQQEAKIRERNLSKCRILRSFKMNGSIYSFFPMAIA